MSRGRADVLREMLRSYQLRYIFHEESQRKVEKRRHLESVAEGYVCTVSHPEKFASEHVEAVLWLSLEERGGFFKPLHAAAAFAALEMYAANLLVQSWRSEVREIKLYSGYYKHTVESHLKNAEVILQLMGYDVCEEEEVLRLGDPIDRDAVTSAAVDCLVAAAECRILMMIMEGLKDFDLPLSWKDVYRLRRDCSCSPEESVRILVQMYKPKSPKHVYSRHYVSEYPHAPLWHAPPIDVCTELLVDVSTNGTWPQPARGHAYSSSSMPFADKERVKHAEGSYQGSAAITRSDSAQYHGDLLLGVAHSPYKFKKNKHVDVTLPPLVNLHVPDPSYDGIYNAESFSHASYGAGDLGYFYCGSENECYYQCSACCTPGTTNKSSHGNSQLQYCKSRSYHNPRGGTVAADGDHLAKELASVSLRPLPAGTDCLLNGHVLLQEEPAAAGWSGEVPKKSPRRDAFCDMADANVVAEVAQQYLDAQETSAEATSGTAGIGEKSNAQTDLRPSEVWSCGACTFLNAPSRDVCEMCSKSRRVGPEMTPLLSGGKQCPRCTLVNDRDASACNVCNTSLKDSPTYI